MRLHPVSLVVCCSLLAGCAASHDTTEKELSEVRAEVSRLRATQAALTERLEALEVVRGEAAKRGSQVGTDTSARPEGADRPDLEVVRLSPSDGDGDADVDGTRLVVRAVGGEGSVQPKKAEKPIVLRGGYFKKSGNASTPKKSDTRSDPHPTVNP